MHFDAYTAKARIAPALLAVVPLPPAVLAWFPELASVSGLSALGIAVVGVTAILSFQVRRSGQQLQERLFQRWGGAPTTQVLRHADVSIAEADKHRYHAALQRLVPGIRMPTTEDEQHDAVAADQIYVTATAWLRERTRDAAKFPVVASENANYGFHRNLLALRMDGLLAASVAAAGSVALLAFGVSWAAIVAVVIAGACGLIFGLHAREGQFKAAGFAYAQALVRAVDAL